MKYFILVLVTLFIIGCGDSQDNNTTQDTANSTALNVPTIQGVPSPTKDIQHLK